MDAIGYLETTGLPGAIVVADKMLKTAAVNLVGLENTKGGGWVTVIISGDVAAVSVAIETGKQTVGTDYVSSTVLANPAPGISDLSQNPIFAPVPETSTNEETPQQLQVTDVAPEAPAEPTVTKDEAEATCNLCGDPKCPRKLGEPRKKCLHYQELFGKNKQS